MHGRVVAVDLRTSSFVALNESASALWPALGRGATDEELRRALVEEFGVTPEVASRDVAGFVAALRRRDFLEPVDGPLS